MSKGNILGHIIEKTRIKVDPEWVKTITQTPFLVNKKVMKSFLGKINFLRKFISDYIKKVKPLPEMIKKYSIYKWDTREKDAFDRINQAITKSPTLYDPKFSKYFLLYTFAFDTSLAMILTQKDDQDNERPISLMNVVL